MSSTSLDELAEFVRRRMDLAVKDKAIYLRNGARLNEQILQGELNMGGAVLTWIERAQAGAAATADDDAEDNDEAGEPE